jgi:NADH:ubiquinone oxidoreductase subunit F (NADH-binding)/NADH:ubiquinone oxidoreductase subunit E
LSQNLVELIRRHHTVDAPTALDVLKEAMEAHGELTDADRRAAAEASGLPEAAVYGVSTFYDDLLAPRGRRHVRVCTGTACFAAARERPVEELSAGLGLAPGERAADGSVSLAETVCLGFCHSSPAVRIGDEVDAGPGVIERVLAGEERAAPEPEWVSLLPEPVLTRSLPDPVARSAGAEPTGGSQTREADGRGGAMPWAGLRRALDGLGREGLLAEVEAAEVRGRGGAGFPAGQKWAFAAKAKGAEKFIVANGDEGDPGSYIDKHLMERSPELLLEGMALAGFAVGADHGFVLVRSEYPRSKPALERAAARARAAGLLGPAILGTDFGFDVTVIEGAGSYVVGEETALLACVQGLRGTVSARPPFPAERGVYGMPTVVNNVETLCNVPFVAARGADAYRALSPDSETTGSKLVCFNERFARPSVYEVPFGITVRQLCEDVAGGLRDGARIKAVQIGGPLGGILPAALLDTPFDFDALAAVGCMVGHGSILAFDETTDMRDVARHLLGFGAEESCGKCFPCRIGMRRAYEEFAAEGPIDRGRFEALLETLELGSLCAHGSGIPAPMRSLLTHWPDELGLR